MPTIVTKAIGVVLGGLLPSTVLAQAGQQPQLPGTSIPQFVDPLPSLHITGATDITLSMSEFQSPMLPTGFVGQNAPYTGTWVWGYRDQAGHPGTSYLGPVVLATRGVPTTMRFRNELPDTMMSNVAFWKAAVDQTLHWADPMGMGHSMGNYMGPVPAVPHLHGGVVPPQLDGGPDGWVTPDGLYRGASFYSLAGNLPNEFIYRYPNVQEAAPIWFHDHGLGVTRLNVYAGLAGGYLIADPAQALPAGLTAFGIGTETIVPLVIQDRMFDVDGQLFFPNVGINMEHPLWVPEFFGDTICVNGKVWPTFGTQAAPAASKRYRFLFLNGSNARAYELFLVDPVTLRKGPPMYVIGTDGGYLDTPVKIDPTARSNNKLIMLPGERYDVVIDFNDPAWRRGNPNFSGQLELKNTAPTPYPAGLPVDPATTGKVMKFWIGAPVADTGYNPRNGGALRPPMVRLASNNGFPNTRIAARRVLTLNEFMGMGGPLEVLVNNTKWTGKSVATDVFPGGIRPDFRLDPNGLTGDYYSELPQEGTTELWEIVNMTVDAHPMHFHLTQFQLLNRQPYNQARYTAAYDARFPASSAVDPMTGLPYPGGVFIGGFGPPLNYQSGNRLALGGNPEITWYLSAAATQPLPQERGWKDTVVMYPGQVTRVLVRWAPMSLPINAPAAQLAYPFDPSSAGYVWHCHIVDHEDNEMMRQDAVLLNPSAPAPAVRPLVKGVHY